MTNPNDRAAIRQLFDSAAACGDRYKCPPADELDRLARIPGQTTVLEVAFDLMADPKVRSFDRLGTAAYETARAWAHAKVQARTFDEKSQETFMDGINRILAVDSSTFVIPAYSLLDGPIGYAIPSTRSLLVAEATKAGRTTEEVRHATEGLRHYTTDLAQVRAWLTSKDAREMTAGAALLDAVDHTMIKQDTDELPLLMEVAKRADLPEDVALALVDHVASHEDNAFLPVLGLLERHSAAEVRAKAREASDQVKKAEAARAK
jgi:hypothetical protein